MSFWTLESFERVLGGVWLVPADGAARDGALTGVCTDSRVVKPGQVFIALRGENTDGHHYLAQAAAGGAALLIIDDAASAVGLPTPALHVRDTGAALLDLAAAYRNTLTNTTVIAVGGSNGKTTTVKLIDQVLATRLKGRASIKSFNNAVGVPLTILGAEPSDQYLICEVGTNAPGEIAPLAAIVQPDIAVITSIGREHLEGLGSLEGVLNEEVSLLRRLRTGGAAVLNADAAGLLEAARAVLDPAAGHAVSTFGAAANADVRTSQCTQRFEGLRFNINDASWFELPLLGEHNAANAAAAVSVGWRLGLDDRAIAEGLAQAKGPEMRLERVVLETAAKTPLSERGGTQGGKGNQKHISFINDAYNANPDSALAALKTFAAVAAGGRFARRVLVLGDMLELGEQAPDLHREVGEAAAAVGADLVVLVGGLSLYTGERLSKMQPGVNLATFIDLAEGRDAQAAALLRGGDLVLLKGSRRMGLERVIGAARGAGHPETTNSGAPSTAQSAVAVAAGT